MDDFPRVRLPSDLFRGAERIRRQQEEWSQWLKDYGPRNFRNFL